MLLTSARERPCNAFTLRVSAERAIATWLFSTFAEISRGSFQFNLPFGPSTATEPLPSIWTLTLSVIWMVLFPIRDITITKRRPAVRRRRFIFWLPGRIKRLAAWIRSPRPCHQAPAGFHRHQRNGAIQDDSPV